MIQRLSTRLLHQLNTQYASFVNDRLVDGIHLAFEFQCNRFTAVDSNAPAEVDSVRPQFGITTEGRNGLNATYQVPK
jgi:hypothetical protein